MFYHGSDLIAGAPFLTGTLSGVVFAVIGFNWTRTASIAVGVSVVTMIAVGLVIRRRQQSETTIQVNNFILK